MPLYEYECRSCSERVEVIQRFSDPPSTICPQCGGELRKLQSAPAIQFKGSGFYSTDYARSGSDSTGDKTPSPANPESANKSESSSGPKADTTPSAKSEP